MRSASCYDADRQTARAIVAVPSSEWNRVRREQRGGTLLVIDCISSPEGACDDTALDAVRAASSSAGLNILSTLPPPLKASPNNSASNRELGVTHDVARVLWVRIRPSFGMSQGEVMYAWTEISATLSETGDGAVLSTMPPEKVKGALPHMERYSELDATRESLKNAIQSLARRLVPMSRK